MAGGTLAGGLLASGVRVRQLRAATDGSGEIEWLPRRRMAAESTRKAIAAGIPYACGTDAMHGAMAYEIRAHVEIGILAETAILAATRDAAACCGLEERLGTLEAGKEADVIAVEGDPLRDVQALERVGLVMKGGRRYEQLSPV